MFWLLGCTTPVPPPPPPGLREALTLSVPRTVDRDVGRTYAWSDRDWGAQTMSVRVGGVSTTAAVFFPHEPGPHGAVVATGHFDKGKSGPDAQDIAHRFARMGLTTVVVDDFGSEELSGRLRALHFDLGAENRAWLRARGTSPLALQLAALRTALDHLDSRGVDKVVATGASGGAVLSYWLAVVDDRVDGVVLAAAPDIPREPAGGCDCKDVPGFPGPDERVLASTPVPSLWLVERDLARPEALPDTATWQHHPGPHAYTTAMQRAAVAWVAELLRVDEAWSEEPVPNGALETRPTPAQRAAGIQDLF